MRPFAALWGLTGFVLLLGAAVHRLTPMALDALAFPMSSWHWAALVANVLFMAYSEGYRGFQKSYSPRLAARLIHVRDAGTTTQCLLAPLYVMGFFGASRKRLIVTYALTIGIIILILIFRLIPQPWRGVLDAGVVVGLVWGMLATVHAVAMRWFDQTGDLSQPDQQRT